MVVMKKAEKPTPMLDLCPLCVTFISNSINDLIQIILNAGVLGSCSELCGLLPNQIEATICNLLCDYVGIEAFIDLINDADPDPIWICEEIDVCPVNDNAAANITSWTIQPSTGRRGTTFQLSLDYTVTDAIGTGEIALLIVDPEGNGLGDGQLVDSQNPGQYSVTFSLKATPSEQESFPPGVYQTEVAICEGTCGSTHSNSFTLATAFANFTIGK